MRFTTVYLTFKGTKTLNESYQLHLSELKEDLLLTDVTDIDEIRRKKLEVLELLAIITNKESQNRGHKPLDGDKYTLETY